MTPPQTERTTSTPPPSSTTSQSPPVVLTVEEQDEAVFGNMNASLADALATFVQSAIQSGVQSLPLLQDTELLQTTIEKPYFKYVDLMEVYGERNIFTLRSFPSRRRQEILERLQNNEGINGNNLNGDETEQFEVCPPAVPAKEEGGGDGGEDSTSTHVAPTVTMLSTKFPPPTTIQDIPSKEELLKLEDEVSQLSAQLKLAMERRNALVQQGAFLTVAHSTTAKAVGSLQESELFSSSNDDSTTTTNTDLVQNAVTAAVMGGQGLQALTQEGKRLQSELEERKRRQQEDGDDDSLDEYQLGMGLPSFNPKKTKRTMTVHEMYQQDRQAISTSVENLASLSNLLKKNNNNKNKAVA